MTVRYDPRLRIEGRRSTGVWGAAAGVTVLAVLLAYFVYAHLYLAVSADEWPPPETPALPVGAPFGLVALVVLAALCALRAGRPTEGEDLRRAGLLAAGAVLGGLALVLGAALVGDLDLAGTVRAHDASALVLHAIAGAVAAAGVLINGLASYEAARLGDHPWVGAASVVAAIWWSAVATTWLVVAAVVYAWPEVS